MRVLVIGGGGREHALAWLLSRDSDVAATYVAPGNPGAAEFARTARIPATDIGALKSFALSERIDLTVVGPELPLALGVVDVFRSAGLPIFGPTRGAAQIEWSKSFAKALCEDSGVPVAHWRSFDDAALAKQALSEFRSPWVVKADGLAAGKGVTVATTLREAEAAIDRLAEIPPGRIVIEEYVEGWEATVTATVAGEEVHWVGPIFQDSKQVGDGDTGPNTGGMGVFTPVPEVTRKIEDQILKTILKPLARGLARRGTPFFGLLSPNLMIEWRSSKALLLECNCRFGDPETQALAPFVAGGLAGHFLGIATGASKITPLRLARDGDLAASVNLVVAADGYPNSPSTGVPIQLTASPAPGVRLFHAGTARSESGELVVAGGRVFNVVATGPSVAVARERAYTFARDGIHFTGRYFRSDIGELGCSRPRPSMTRRH